MAVIGNRNIMLAGLKGHKGDKGDIALAFNDTLDFNIEPVTGANYSAEFKYFNRTPEVGETFTYPARYGEETYEIQCKVTALGQYVDYEIINVLYTRGAAGGTTLNQYTATINTSTDEGVNLAFKIICNAKGSIRFTKTETGNLNEGYVLLAYRDDASYPSVTIGQTHASSSGRGFQQKIINFAIRNGVTVTNQSTIDVDTETLVTHSLNNNPATIKITYYNDTEIL